MVMRFQWWIVIVMIMINDYRSWSRVLGNANFTTTTTITTTTATAAAPTTSRSSINLQIVGSRVHVMLALMEFQVHSMVDHWSLLRGCRGCCLGVRFNPANAQKPTVTRLNWAWSFISTSFCISFLSSPDPCWLAACHVAAPQITNFAPNQLVLGARSCPLLRWTADRYCNVWAEKPCLWVP